MADSSSTNLNYIDNAYVKLFTENNLVDKYFTDTDPSLRTVGMLGYTTELITNFGEDTFNTGSVLFRESFPNRAQIPESIYSHAALFQISNVFSSAASCKFLLVMEEDAIIKNMIDSYDKDTGMYHFYIDKNTTITVEDLIFTLDYDIRMNIVKRTTENGDEYIFSAMYIMDEYVNSISDITDPYVKIRRSSDGYLALEVQTHQCEREVVDETIISNSTINYPVINIPVDGKLAGFDILYKAPDAEGYTQLRTQLVYSQAIKEPFCYYEMIDENTIRLSFNAKDNYFMPDFNSSLQIILYITNGSAGNFDVYTGTNITLMPNNEKYSYANTYLTAAQPSTASKNGQDQMEMDALQSLAVENYRTATALTTENDLREYFSNYKYRYGDADVMFIKKRDDVYERVYSAFLIIRNNNYIYNTNTLNLKLNLSDMKLCDKNEYILEPGYLFTCNDCSGYAEIFRDSEKYEQYYNEYLEAIENGEIPYITDNNDSAQIPPYLDRPASFAEFKARYNLDDKQMVFDFDADSIVTYDNPREKKFMIMNPFLVRFTKDPNMVTTYMTYVSNASLVDFTDQNEDSFVQFILYTLYMNRKFEKSKKYEIYTKIGSSVNVDATYPVVEAVLDEHDLIDHYILNDKYNVVNNDVRVIMLIKDGTKNVCFTELWPTEYDKVNANFKFEGLIQTDDHITSESKLRILSGTIYRNSETGEYYKVHETDNTLYDQYNKDDEIIATDIPVDTITELTHNGTIKKWSQVVKMSSANDILIPMTDVTCKIYTLYRRTYKEDVGLVLTTEEQTNNMFSDYDETLKGYIWTNEYSTTTEPITFMKPLNSVRTYLKFEDYTEAEEIEDEDGGKKTVFTHDIMDAQMYSLSFVRAAITYDKDLFSYFMDSFYTQYNFLSDIINTRLRNATNIDIKFYNTYGRSNYFVIGETDEILDTVNISLQFDMWFLVGTDLLYAIPEVKNYIKEQVEIINDKGMNNLFISNLMRKIENNFAFVDHIRFKNINYYPSTYQAVKNYVTDLDDLTVEERRFYVPELLVCDIDDITINEYYVS